MKIILTDKEKEKFQEYVDKINEKTGLHRTVDELINEIGNNQKDLWKSFSYKRFCEASDSLLPDGVETWKDHRCRFIYDEWSKEHQVEFDFYKSLDWFSILIEIGENPTTSNDIESALYKYREKYDKALSKVGISAGYWTPFFNNMNFDEVFDTIIKQQVGNSVKILEDRENEKYNVFLDFVGKEFQDWLETHSTRLT